MATLFEFERSEEFAAERAGEMLARVPATPGVLCLRGARAEDEPYLTRTADMRRRAMRLLAPPEMTEDGRPVLSRRLNLRDRVARVEWTAVGSEFEGLLVLYHATAQAFGYASARRRLRLHTPYFVRLTGEHAHPRLYVTNRISPRGMREMYGPFPSRMAAERYSEAVGDLFKLRRCHEDLQPYPEHPGCAYGEMKKCLAPCNVSCSAEDYGKESAAVRGFLATRGESLLGGIALERERASEEMDFERAAALHTQYTKVKGAAGLADDLVRLIPELRAVVVQRAAVREDRVEAAVSLLQGGCLAGPERLSTLGVRAVKEQTSVGSSLFAQPLMLQAVPLGPAEDAANSPEARAAGVLGRLEAAASGEEDVAMVSDHLSLVKRWYYRPEKQRAGEIFFPNEDGSWPVRRILRGAARAALGEPGAMAETQRDALKDVAKGKVAGETKVLHAGREGVERVVSVVGRRKRRAVVPEGVDAV